MAKRKRKTCVSLEIPLYRVVGWDPGRINCGLAVFGPNGLEKTDVIEGTLDDLANLDTFGENVGKQLDWYKPEASIVERYQLRARKGFVGNMEAVNQMIGAIRTECRIRNIPCKLVTAATHKTWAGRFHGATKKSGKLCMHTCLEFKHLSTEHEADAANVARYGAQEVFIHGKAQNY